MLLSQKTNKLIAASALVFLVGFQSMDVMARVGGGSRASGFSSSRSYSSAGSSRAGGAGNTGMQRNDVVSKERQNTTMPNQQQYAPQATPQAAPSKIGLGHVAGAAVAGAAVGYMLNSHSNNQPMQNNGGSSGQYGEASNGQPARSGFPWGSIMMLLLLGFGLMWLYKRTAGFKTVGTTMKAVFNPQANTVRPAAATFTSSTNQVFEAEALKFFNALQDANNRGDIQFMKTYSVGDMQSALIDDINSRTAPSNSTFSLIVAKVIDMTTEGNQNIVSVRFTGMAGEANSAFEPMDEVWHLVRQSGEWQLAGIEQI